LLTRKPLVWHAREIVVQSSAALQLERWLCRHFADVVIAASRPVADQLAGSRVVVVHDVPDPTEFTPARAGKFRAVSGIPDDVPLIGSAGRIDTWKGFEILLDAVPSIQSVRKDAYFVIAGGAVAGKEAFASTLARRADQLENVYWMGERQDMPELLADLDVFVLASTEPEPFGSVLAEALAAGVPCVATDHGGSPEMLAQFSPEISRLVPPRDQKALAEAVLALLPAGASSPGSRRLRPAQIMSRKTTFDTVYAAVVRGPQDIEKLADI
jgi:glycosyltransferase involved in cell wall biosynthesis